MDDAFDRGYRAQPLWLAALLLIVLGQGAIALHVLGGLDALSDDRPVLAGRHPLHLYHGMLGAETFRQRYVTACYDPCFQAGYPKTPVFDGGCRLAEFLLVFTGTGHAAAVYKVGLFLLLISVPLAFALAGRGAGISAAGCGLAAALGSLLSWTPPVRRLLQSGDCDLILAGLCAVVFVAWLSRYHWDAGPLSWLVLALTAVLGWYAHPVIWIALLPVVLLYYVAAAPRHGPAWHLGMLGIGGVGLAPNMWWLWDWGKFWWLRQPSVDDLATFPTWGAIVGTTSENLALAGRMPLGWPLALFGLLACVALLGIRKKSAPVLMALTGLLALLVARLGQVWPPFMNGGAERAAPLALVMAVLPAAAVVAHWAHRAALGLPVLIVGALLPAYIAFTPAPLLREALQLNLTSLPTGFTDEQFEFIRGLEANTTAEARILLEDTPPGSRPAWNWTALLPRQVDRSFLGGLDAEARFEHSYCGLMDGRMNGRSLDQWTDADLNEFATLYNVGWIACRSAGTRARWLALPGSRVVGEYQDGGPVTLIELQRQRSFILAGQAKWEQADRRKVVLTDIVPADAPHPDGGPMPAKVIVLSLHYQAGLKVSPNIVKVEKVPNANDPIPLVRLRVNGPLSRIVLSWENR